MTTVTLPAMFDLSSLDIVKSSNDGAEIAILHPVTKEPVGITITVLGADSATFKKVYAEQNRRRMAKIEKAGKGYNLTSVSPEEREEDALDLLAACTKSWTNLGMDGAALDCNRESAIAVYERMPWLREQVDIAIGDRANFIRG